MLRNLNKVVRAGLTDISSAEQYNKLASSKKPHILNFSAVWCGPCKKMVPILKKLEGSADGKWELYKVDVDAE